MPHDINEWQRRIKAVEREHSATRLAADRLLGTAGADPTVLGGKATIRDLVQASERLEGTYIIRLFAEFETALRLFWPTARRTDPPSRTRDLPDGVAATRRIPHDHVVNAHAVREYGNNLLHEREEATLPVEITAARGHLCRFSSFLPPRW